MVSRLTANGSGYSRAPTAAPSGTARSELAGSLASDTVSPLVSAGRIRSLTGASGTYALVSDAGTRSGFASADRVQNGQGTGQPISS